MFVPLGAHTHRTINSCRVFNTIRYSIVLCAAERSQGYEEEAGLKMRIGNAENAESVVRKYFLGTRTFHGKIVSMSAEDRTEGPDDKGTWKIKGTYLTDAGVRARFAATVSSRGEVLITSSSSTKVKTQPGRSSVAHRLSNADYAARRQRKKQRMRKRTKLRRNPS